MRGGRERETKYKFLVIMINAPEFGAVVVMCATSKWNIFRVRVPLGADI